ncbi:MAG: MFS transporter [Bulleidia sp.]
MKVSSERIKTLIYLESFTCSDVLINSVRTYFIISIVLDNSILPVLKFIMLFVTLVTEIPSGYFSNKYGDKLALIFSKFFNLIAILFLILASNKYFILIAYIFLGLGSSFESGARNAFFLDVCYSNKIDYKAIRVDLLQKMTVFKFVMLIVGSYLYSLNKLIPFIVTAILFIMSSLIVMRIPNPTGAGKRKISEINTFTDAFKIIKKIQHNSNIRIELIRFTVATTSLIFIFDYYQSYFKDMGLQVQYFGMIYATFKLFNYLGGTLFKKKIGNKVSLIFLIISLIVFLKPNIYTIFLAIAIQQTFYNYENISFEYDLIQALEFEKEGALYESVISLCYAVGRLLILQLLIVIMNSLGMNYTIGFLILLLTILLWKTHIDFQKN